MIQFISNIQWNEWFRVIRFIFYFLDALLIGLIILSLVKVWPLRPKFTIFTKRPKKAVTLHAEAFRDQWQAIIKKIASDSPEIWKLALIEADSLVDDLLKHLNYPGEHMADRLAKLDRNDFTTLDRLWNAHRVRNNLVHIADFKISQDKIKGILEDYEAFLKEIGVLKEPT